MKSPRTEASTQFKDWSGDMRSVRGADWEADAFGEHVEVLRERIPAALAVAHTRARAGHDAARSTKLRVYGTTLWECQHEELVAAVMSIDGAKVAKFGGYELPVVADRVLFPLRYADRSGVPVKNARLPVPVSGQRQRLFGAHATEVERPHPYLDESWADYDLPEDYEVFPQLGDGTELIVIAYACNLEAGVMNIEWGRAKHVGGGELLWGEHTPLPLVPAGLPGIAKDSDGLNTAGQGSDVPRFDAAEEPGLPLGPRPSGDRKLDVPPLTERRTDEAHTRDNDQN
ncbi:hypothetical protein FEK35_13790 [Nocardia cyriacigeorgica]|uniref:Uncharacterized protein n=1 Tax=Nocardia cyriacigeorgica TaxID=135487 RepID=A0A5R8PDJ2_9NOCA|nr:hypothetical protein [Nocardia cyriacigeorgica]TLG10270.1 hypothetical protein FEK35_13790 [Nocardia cyriacigeorgica]